MDKQLYIIVYRATEQASWLVLSRLYDKDTVHDAMQLLIDDYKMIAMAVPVSF